MLEREIIKKNLIVKGIEDEEDENEIESQTKIEKLIQNLRIKFNSEADMEEVRRVGKYRSETKRPILIKLVTEKKRNEILSQAKALKGTNIWIEEDFTKEVQMERKELMPHLKEARQKGYTAKLKFNKPIINGKIYGVQGDSHIISGIAQDTEFEHGGESSGKTGKRKASERSPQQDTFEEQLKKITRTTRPLMNKEKGDFVKTKNGDGSVKN